MPEDSEETRRWQDRLDGHGVEGWTVGISNLTRTFAERYPNADHGDIEYLENLVDLVRRYLGTSDPRRVTESMLTELEQALTSLSEYLNDACNKDATVTDWQLSFGIGDAVIDALSRWPDLEALKIVEYSDSRISENERRSVEVAENVQEQWNANLQEIESSLTTVGETLNTRFDALLVEEVNLSSRIAAQVELIGQQLPTLQAQISTQREEFASAEDARRKEYISAIDSLRANASETIETQRGEFEELVRKLEDETSRSRETDSEKFEELTKKLESDSVAAVERLDDILREAQVILQVISRTAMSGGYQKYGDDERASANQWRTLSIIIASIATVVLAAFVIWGHRSSNVPWTVDAGRFLLAASLAGLSTYSAKQSSSHRRRGERANSLALQLASIGPYLEGLPEEEKQEVLKNLAYRFFTEDLINEVDEVDNGPSNWVHIFEILKSKGGS